MADASVERLDASFHSADSVDAFATFFAPDSASVSRSVDFVSVGAHETDVVGSSVVRLASGRTDSQQKFRQVAAKRAGVNQLIISRTVKQVIR